MKTHRHMWAVVAALMLALFVAACGEEKDEVAVRDVPALTLPKFETHAPAAGRRWRCG